MWWNPQGYRDTVELLGWGIIARLLNVKFFLGFSQSNHLYKIKYGMAYMVFDSFDNILYTYTGYIYLW